MDTGTPPADSEGQVVAICFLRFSGVANRVWAFVQMGLARRALRAIPGLGFFKLMGAGTGEGFTPVPDTGAVAILTTWRDLATARRGLEEAPVFRRYRARATEHWTIFLSPRSAWGAWSGVMPFHPVGGPAPGPIVALTRATLRPRVLLKFWRRVPAISGRIGANPDVIFKAGVGEVPWFHQMTFSIWPDAASMSRFARADGPHAQAIRAVREGNWFSEELYARFAILDAQGTWGGCDPLAAHQAAVAAE